MPTSSKTATSGAASFGNVEIIAATAGGGVAVKNIVGNQKRSPTRRERQSNLRQLGNDRRVGSLWSS